MLSFVYYVRDERKTGIIKLCESPGNAAGLLRRIHPLVVLVNHLRRQPSSATFLLSLLFFDVDRKIFIL